MKTCHDVGCKWPECSCKVPDYAFSEHNRRAYCVKLKKPRFSEVSPPLSELAQRAASPNLDPIQNSCKYGYVLPDRCRYWRHKGCPCGAYPPEKSNG